MKGFYVKAVAVSAFEEVADGKHWVFLLGVVEDRVEAEVKRF